MRNATAPGKPGVKMTIHVYTMDRHGTRTEDRGTVDIPHSSEPLPLMSMNPPCRCPRCRAGQAAAE
jgi:hypothetical protein